MNNSLKIAEIVNDLTPLCQKAADAYTDFNKKWEIGIAKSGYRYKNSDYNKEALNRLKTATADINTQLIPALDKLRSNDLSELNILLAFLKIDTTFFRAGNFRDNICIALKNVELNEEYTLIVQQIIIDRMTLSVKEYRQFAKLGPKVQTPQFIKKLESLSNDSDERIAKHAARVIEWIEEASSDQN
jgi:hypothetical protein